MNKFWNWIKDEGGRMLRLEGPIDEDNFWGDEITPKAFRDELEADTGDVTVWINSPGGNVFAAAEIYTMLKEYAGKITVRIASLAASAASVVAMAGDRIEMSPTALMMIHDPSTIAMGNAAEMQKVIATLNAVKDSILNAYTLKTGLRKSKISEMMENETWLERKLETIQHLEKAKTEIRMIALGDKLSNVRAMHRDYQVHGDKFWEKFNNPDSKAQGMYYCSLANAFWKDEAIRKTPAFKEYADLCAEVFHVERDQDGKMIVPEI